MRIHEAAASDGQQPRRPARHDGGTRSTRLSKPQLVGASAIEVPNLLNLQRTVGNQVVVALLGDRQSRAPSVQRCGAGGDCDCVAADHAPAGSYSPAVQRQDTEAEKKEPRLILGPAVTGKTKKELARKSKLADKAWEHLQQVGFDYLTLWLAAANGALAGANEPADPAAKSHFDRALAGNLVWAATSLFAKWHPIVIAMSFVGASAGSSGGGPPPAPSGKRHASLAIARLHDTLRDDLPETAAQAATHCIHREVLDPLEQRRILWDLMFPKMPFEKTEAITEEMLRNIEQGLEQFLRQWSEWRKVIEDCARARLIGEPDRGTIQASAMPGVQRQILIVPTKSKSREQCEREHPFHPILTFEWSRK